MAGVKIVNTKHTNVQNDLKPSQKHTKTINDRQTMMLKMVTSYSIFLFIILVLFSYLYLSDTKNARTQYQWQVKATLMSNVELFEKDLDIMDAYCRQFLQNNDFRKLARSPEDTPQFLDLGSSLATTMATDVYPEALLPMSEVYFYLPHSDFILSPNCFIDKTRFYTWIKKYPAAKYEDFAKTLTDASYYNRFVPMDEWMPTSGKRYYMYLIDMNSLYYLDIDAIACFVLPEDELSSLFECMDAETPYRYLSIINGQSERILSLSTAASAKFDSITAAGTPDELQGTLDAAKMSIDTYTSADTEFTYYYTYPSFASAANNAPPQILYAALFTATLIGGLIIIFWLSKRNIRPILELGQQLQVTEQEKTHLKEVMDSQRPIIFNSYVRQFLKGMIVSQEEASYAKEFLGLADESLVFNGLYVVAYNSADQHAVSSDFHSPEECNRMILNALRQFSDETLYYFSPSDRVYAVIVVGKADDAKDLIIKTNEMVVKIHNYLLETYGIWLFAGIGKTTDDILNVWESYQQAMEAVNYTSKNYFFFPYEFIQKDSSAFYYPTELSTKLIHFISTGNTSQVMELFNLIHQENIEERSLPINMVQFLLSDIRNTLLKARFALPQGTPKEIIQKLDECFAEHVSFKLCEDIALKLCTLFTIKSDDTDLISLIEKYIHDNYADPSMGLNKISDEFQISESYFSHLFKEKKGVNFSTYLESIRLNEAARLIRETDISLNELYLCIGYNNANSFRRAFKKIYGVTPSAMRDSVK